jgi:hypothetical protein
VKVNTTNLLVTVIDDNIYTLGNFSFIDSDRPIEGYYSLGNLLNFDNYTGWDKHYNVKSDDEDGKITITEDTTFNYDKALRRFKNTFTLNYYETVSQYIPGTGDVNNGKFNVIVGENSIEKNKESLPEGYNNVKEWYEDYLRIINNKGF